MGMYLCAFVWANLVRLLTVKAKLRKGKLSTRGRYVMRLRKLLTKHIKTVKELVERLKIQICGINLYLVCRLI